VLVCGCRWKLRAHVPRRFVQLYILVDCGIDRLARLSIDCNNDFRRLPDSVLSPQQRRCVELLTVMRRQPIVLPGPHDWRDYATTPGGLQGQICKAAVKGRLHDVLFRLDLRGRRRPATHK